MPRRWVRSIVVLALVALFASPARGEGKRDKGQKVLEQGRRAYNLGHWSDALADFEKAYEISGDPAILFNLAEAHRQLGQTADALRLYNAYLREQPYGAEHEAAEKAIENLNPPVAPKPLPTIPPPVAAPAPQPAPTPPPPVAPPPAAGPPTLVTQAPPAARPHRSKWPVIAGAAATGALAAGAIVFTVSGNNLYNDLQGSCGNTAVGCAPGQVDSVRTRDRAATALWILAGAAAVATSVVLVFRF